MERESFFGSLNTDDKGKVVCLSNMCVACNIRAADQLVEPAHLSTGQGHQNNLDAEVFSIRFFVDFLSCKCFDFFCITEKINTSVEILPFFC